jgi:FdhD protein
MAEKRPNQCPHPSKATPEIRGWNVPSRRVLPAALRLLTRNAHRHILRYPNRSMPTYLPATDAVTAFSLLRIGTDAPETHTDLVATEEPLEIQLGYTRRGVEVWKTVAITMRTPGHDQELAAGFLLTEGIVRDPADIAEITSPPERPQTVIVRLRADVAVDVRPLERNNYMTSSCGVCGKASLNAVRATTRHPLPEAEPLLDPEIVHHLPAALRATQSGFDQTGGLHAAALFTFDGRLVAIREDIGRHNAVDKLIGSQLLRPDRDALPLSARIVLVSSRASFELVQKVIMAGCPVLATVGAPSSLAIELARETGATLLGFVRDHRFNVYAGATRLRTRTTALAAS